MPKIECKCGNFIGLGEIPSPNQSLIISDVEFDKFQGILDIEEVYKSMKIVAHCNVCQRLHIFYEGFNNEATVYFKEE